jgi:hypothetical protein
MLVTHNTSCPTTSLASRLTRVSITLAILSAPFWATSAHALSPEGLTGPFALDNWKLIASYIDAGNELEILSTTPNPGYICTPANPTACVEGPEPGDPIETNPGAFTVVGGLAEDFAEEVQGSRFFLNWTLDPALSNRTIDYFLSFDFLFQTSDIESEIKGYFSINNILTPIQTSTDGDFTTGVFRISPSDTIAFGLNSSNFDNNESFVIINNFIADVPGPLPLLGVGAAFGWSRRLRSRVSSHK